MRCKNQKYRNDDEKGFNRHIVAVHARAVYRQRRRRVAHSPAGQLRRWRNDSQGFAWAHFHGDHAYVFYQQPVDARRLPLVFAHGVGQFSKTWETTPDGREGFQNIFLRKGFSLYLVDQPRRGNAGRSTEEAVIKPAFDEEQCSTASAWGIGRSFSTACSSAVTAPRSTSFSVR